MKQNPQLFSFLVIWLLSACSREGTEAVVAMSQSNEPPDLGATAWQVEDIDQGGIVDMSMLTMEFKEGGRIAGMAGCNRYFGSVTYDASNFLASGLGTTQMACAPALMDQESRFFDAVESAVRFEIQDDRWLTLFDAQGDQRISLIMNASGTNLPPAQVPQDLPSDSITEFACDDGPQFELRFLGPETIRLSVEDQDYVLQRERAASGARYTGDGIGFWNKGDEAMLDLPGGNYRCVKSDAEP